MFWLALKWAIMLIIWGIIAIHIMSDRKMLRRLRLPTNIAVPLRILFQRNLQLFVIITLLMILVGIRDVPNSLRHLVKRFFVVETNTSTTEAAPPLSSAQPEPNTTAAVLPKVIPPSSSMPFMDITEFNEKNGHEQAYIDFLKQRYEAWLVTYYYLHKCNQAEEGDLTLIKTALESDLKAAHAQNDVENNILGAATGSYMEMYKDAACDMTSISNSKTSYLANMQQLHIKNTILPLK